MLRYKYFLILFLFFTSVMGQGYNYKFRVLLEDKGNTGFSIDNPIQFLSQEAIDRRARQGIAIDETDLPVSADYISEVELLGCIVVAKSKWLNSLTVHCADSSLIENIKALDFVKDAVFVWKGTGITARVKTSKSLKRITAETDSYYGPAYKQIAMHKGDLLHSDGYRGEGMKIAVIDAGFENINENLMLSNAMIQEFKDFVYQGDNPTDSNHGIKVLSCMATSQSNTFVGTAPNAKYWLLRSENPASEFPVEEDYWVAAAEYADSIGVDLINTSLGYSWFDKPAENLVYEQIDGKTTFITRGADMAASKGIFVVGSAGNEGAKTWRHITVPGDAASILTVGAIRADSTITSFSSRGPTYDSRIKPDVVALGDQVPLIDQNGNIGTDSGTSMSSPIMCGLAACLWQANPGLTSVQLGDVIRRSSNRYSTPDNDYGYGIPDMMLAMEIAQSYLGIDSNETETKNYFGIVADSTGTIRIQKLEKDGLRYDVRIYSIDGRTLVLDSFTEQEKAYKVPSGKKNIYIVNVKCKEFAQSRKICL